MHHKDSLSANPSKRVKKGESGYIYLVPSPSQKINKQKKKTRLPSHPLSILPLQPQPRPRGPRPPRPPTKNITQPLRNPIPSARPRLIPLVLHHRTRSSSGSRTRTRAAHLSTRIPSRLPQPPERRDALLGRSIGPRAQGQDIAQGIAAAMGCFVVGGGSGGSS
ncbi:hypothetical protein BS50DRAFT_372477 [Corynespora cassiicola Philippines]|uniref:Uncharacterized protein n=1 Tax=Corynespora cassiicola Philippines TaxID=1448308 RepID=A0A2T2NMR8_CORCC|nr:hypothetical protein BS50DRAFT_372477 [Corynespora cassiicola Philippines]